MGGVVLRREDGGEALAGGIAGPAQEARSFALALPVGNNADAAAIGEDEAGDVYGVASRVFASWAFIGTVKAPAAVTAKMLDLRYPDAENLLRRGLDAAVQPKG